jgi:hypothetical protein
MGTLVIAIPSQRPGGLATRQQKGLRSAQKKAKRRPEVGMAGV